MLSLLHIIGINHRTAPIALRERLAFPAETLPAAYAALRAESAIREAVLLFTCNRTELLCVTDDAPSAVRWLLAQSSAGAEVSAHLYHYRGAEAVRHLLRVGAGLDSMVLGEPQILGQLKEAYATAQAQQSTAQLLNKLLQHSFFVAKKIRTDTEIGNNPVSVAFAAVRLAETVHGDLRQCTALLIGAGDTIELTAQHLEKHGLARLLIANRTLARAQHLAERHRGMAMTLDDLPKFLPQADIVVSATGAALTILGVDTIAQALRARRNKPVFMVDLAVPRDIDPLAGDLADVYLYTVDDLQAVVAANQHERQAAAAQAQALIDLEALKFAEALENVDAVELLRGLRARAENARNELLTRAQADLAAGQSAAAVVEQLAQQLTARLLHAPTVRLKDAGIESRDDLLRAAAELFDLPKS